MQDNTEKKRMPINPKLVSSAVMLIITGSLLVAISFAWFSQNKEVVSSGMSVSAIDERITIGSSVYITRSIGDTVVMQQEYRSTDSTNVYYLWEDGQFVLDENSSKIPIALTALLPGEAIEMEFSYTCTDNLVGKTLELYLDGITADMFNEVSSKGEIGEAHTVLCVYKLSYKEGDGDYSEARWMAGSEDTESPSKIHISDALWHKVSDNDVDNYVTASLKIEFDLEQYYTLETSANQLSEKSFSIGSLEMGVKR